MEILCMVIEVLIGTGLAIAALVILSKGSCPSCGGKLKPVMYGLKVCYKCGRIEGAYDWKKHGIIPTMTSEQEEAIRMTRSALAFSKRFVKAEERGFENTDDIGLDGVDVRQALDEAARKVAKAFPKPERKATAGESTPTIIVPFDGGSWL
jgi:hypothetical protein